MKYRTITTILNQKNNITKRNSFNKLYSDYKLRNEKFYGENKLLIDTDASKIVKLILTIYKNYILCYYFYRGCGYR